MCIPFLFYVSYDKLYTWLLLFGVKKKNGNFSVQLKKTTICKAFFSSNIYKRSPFLFGCLLFRRCSLSFRNLLSCHTVSRVCHCQSYSDEQSANIDYGILETFGVSSRQYNKNVSYEYNKVLQYGTTRSHPHKQLIRLTIHLSRLTEMKTTRRRFSYQLSTRVMTDLWFAFSRSLYLS